MAGLVFPVVHGVAVVEGEFFAFCDVATGDEPDFAVDVLGFGVGGAGVIGRLIIWR